MDGISERSNGVINTKARALIADAGVNENLWPEAVKTSAYLANRTETSTHKVDDIEQPRRSQRERRTPNRYEGMAINMAMSAVVSEELQEPLTYEQALASSQAEL